MSANHRDGHRNANDKKVRVAIDWALDVLFTKDFVQYLDQRALVHTQTETGAAPWSYPRH